MTNTAWVICKDSTTIIFVSGSRFLVASSAPSGVAKHERIYQYLSKIPGNINQRICRMYHQIRKIPGNLHTKLRIANIIYSSLISLLENHTTTLLDVHSAGRKKNMVKY